MGVTSLWLDMGGSQLVARHGGVASQPGRMLYASQSGLNETLSKDGSDASFMQLARLCKV
jgi:hypothetical protein